MTFRAFLPLSGLQKMEGQDVERILWIITLPGAARLPRTRHHARMLRPINNSLNNYFLRPYCVSRAV